MFIHAAWKDIKPDLWKLSQEDLEKSNRKKRFFADCVLAEAQVKKS